MSIATRIHSDDAQWLRHHVFFPLLFALVAAVVLIPLGGDLWLADRIYAWEGGRWALKFGYVTQDLIHQMGKHLSLAGWLLCVALLVASHARQGLAHWRKPLLMVVLAVAFSTGLVSLMKHLTDMDCPWDLARYGGRLPFVPLLAFRPDYLPRAACFPAGHASAGYAWMVLYFLALASQPRRRWWGLAAGLGAGLVFGLGQQLRGAHFMSHDLFTLVICWFTGLVVYRWMFVPAAQAIPATEALGDRRQRSAA